MIVGNGEIPDGAADTIDRSDLVIRFNDCRSAGRGGRRTDVVAVCNTGRPGRQMLSSVEWSANPAVRSASSIWCVRDPAKFAEMHESIVRDHPGLDDFCVDFTGQFAAFASEHGKTHYVVDRSVHDTVDRELSRLDARPYVVPSSGMIVVQDILDHHAGQDDAVSIAGFGHEGWSGHPFATERHLIEAYISAGRITRLADPTSISRGA